MPTMTPFLWFDADLAEPIAYYRSIFPDLVVHSRQPGPDGSVFGATIEIHGQRVMLMNGGPEHATFTPAFSFFLAVDTQDEIDDLWAKLTADGGAPNHCGWLTDRYGLSWQVVPSVLGELIGGPDAAGSQRALQAMLQMDKLDIAALQAAYDG